MTNQPTTTTTTTTTNTKKDNNTMSNNTATIEADLDKFDFSTRETARAEAARKQKDDFTKRMAILGQLGGAMNEEDDVTFRGTQLVIPVHMDYRGVRDFAQRKMDDDEQDYQVSHSFNYLPQDGAYATAQVIKQFFGVTFGKATMGFFGPNPPQLRSVRVGPGKDETVQVPWGAMAIPTWGENATLHLQAARGNNGVACFHLTVSCKRKWAKQAAGLFKAIEDYLENNSIYRNKAITASEEPEFIDLSKFDPTQVVYSEVTMKGLEQFVWGPIRYREAFELAEQRSKRVTLLSGTFGTGKTLAALMTALECEMAGDVTFIMCRPGQDSWMHAFGLASLYKRVVIFLEDADLLISEHTPAAMSELLEQFDGAVKKGLDAKLVMTTNYVERIPKGMLRPGRMDAIIEVGSMDRPGVEKLIKRLVGDRLEEGIDFDAVFGSFDGLSPAFVREVLDRAVSTNIVNNGGRIHGRFSGQDFIDAADSLRPQLRLMNDAPEAKSPPTLDRVLRKITREAVSGLIVDHPEQDLAILDRENENA